MNSIFKVILPAAALFLAASAHAQQNTGVMTTESTAVRQQKAATTREIPPMPTKPQSLEKGKKAKKPKKVTPGSTRGKKIGHTRGRGNPHNPYVDKNGKTRKSAKQSKEISGQERDNGAFQKVEAE